VEQRIEVLRCPDERERRVTQLVRQGAIGDLGHAYQ
jgi:hypothetical protein